MYDDLRGKVAIITGAGRPQGIGRGIAMRLAREGSHVAIADIGLSYQTDPTYDIFHRGTWEEVLDRQREIEALGVKCLPVKCDATNEKEVENMVEVVIKEFGRVDILVNCVGIGPPRSFGPMIEVDGSGWDASIAINAKSTHLCSRSVAKQMIKQGTGGKIVNISSPAAKIVWPSMGVYGSAKAAVSHYTRVLAQELAPHHITVNAVVPGTTETASHREYLGSLAEKMRTTYDELMKAVPPVPWGRRQTPEDIAAAVVWLVSSEAEFVTGVDVRVDGGQTMV